MSPETLKFIVDADLHALCKALRLLGFDCLYGGNLSASVIIHRAIEERRIWVRLSADLPNLHYGIRYFVIESAAVPDQLRELDARFKLGEATRPFSLCLRCNEALMEIPPSLVQGRVPDRIITTFDSFYTCQQCGRIYWPGSHYRRMQEKLESWGWADGRQS